MITHNPWNPRSIFGVERSSGHHGQSELQKVDQEHPGGRQQTGTSNAIHQERERAGNHVQVEGQGGLEEVEEGAGGEGEVWFQINQACPPGPGGMFLNSSLAHVINTCASTCTVHTC